MMTDAARALPGGRTAPDRAPAKQWPSTLLEFHFGH
jgi:hypothetical protein